MPVKYSGQQNKEAMLYFLKVMLPPSSFPELHGLRESRISSRASGDRSGRLSRTCVSPPRSQFSFWRGTVDGHLDPSLNGFFPTVSAFPPSHADRLSRVPRVHESRHSIGRRLSHRRNHQRSRA